MVTRILPRREWQTRLAGTELERVVPVLPPEAHVLIVEDDAGAIVGCWSAIPYWHVEGVWIAPAHRARSAVARRLLRGMRHLLEAVGVRKALTTAQSDQVRAFIDRLGGVVLPGDHYVLDFGAD